MARPPSLRKIPQAVLDEMFQFIEQGVYPYIAARAVGIPSSTFYRWMEDGENGKQPYAAFWERVSVAHARARLTAELRVFDDKPLEWLRVGPGREKAGAPGWTDAKQVTGVDGGPVDISLVLDESTLEEE